MSGWTVADEVPAGKTDRGRTRGRVVMLVDNAVSGDSRVQKSAASAAEAGWDTILLGQSPKLDDRRWRIGGAQVRLLPVPRLLHKRPVRFNKSLLHGPLAYRSTEVAEYRRNFVKIWQQDLDLRLQVLRDPAPTGRPGRLRVSARRLGLLLPRLGARLAPRWVEFRSARLTAHLQSRMRMDAPTDRLAAQFWRVAAGHRRWRRFDPGLWDYEFAFAPLLDQLKPDIIHANDFRMLGVAARAVIRARAAGRTVKLVWDAHEYLPGLTPRSESVRWLPANIAHEREYAPYADAVMTVSASLAELLKADYRLPELPAVVLNAPVQEPLPEGADIPCLRTLCGIGTDTPLLVYSGATAAQRGLDIMVEALPHLPEVHVAFVVNNPQAPYVQGLVKRAEELGSAARLHCLPYVHHRQVVPFLAGADLGVIPIHHWVNHELALITKFFEYSHARLPIVVSDVRTMAATVRETGQGEAFEAENLDDYLRAVRAVLAEPSRYRAAYDTSGLLAGWTWESQAEVLDEVYSRLMDEPQTSGVVGPRPAGGLHGRPAESSAVR